MSTRRTTRATSRSTRAASPNPSIATTAATPRRRRAGGETLPSVGLRTSTAYGTNTTPKPARVDGPVVSEQIDTVLQNLLAPAANPTQTQAQTQATPASADRSFGIENGLFYGARFDSSVLGTPTPPNSPPDAGQGGSGRGGSGRGGSKGPSNGPSNNPEPPTGIAAQVDPRDAADIQAIEELARTRLQAAGISQPGAASNTFGKFKNMISSIFSFLWSLISAIFSWFSWQILPILTVGLIIFWILNSGYDVKEKIGNFFSSTPSDDYNTGDFTQADHRKINRRISTLEDAVKQINKRIDAIDPEAIEQMNEMLPDLLVVKKDKYQNMMIPDDFWAALQEKIRSDDSIMEGKLDDSVDVGKGKGSANHKDLSAEVEKVAKSAWDRYMKRNENNVKNIIDSELSEKFPRLLEDNHLATKDEVLELLRTSWSDHSANLQNKFTGLSKKVETATRSIEKLQKNPGTVNKDEVTTIATDVLKKLIPHAQLEALAKANLQGSTQNSLARVNHFSTAVGAVINKLTTSPAFVPEQNNVWFFTRWGRQTIMNPVQQPNPPVAALTRWEEYGDCFCGPSSNEFGYGPSIGVITANEVYADQIIVEHIPASATLQPGAAPKEMELVAYYGDLGTYNAVKTASEGLFIDQVDELEHPYRYVRIATWTYDVTGQSTQSFPVQVDTRALGADATNYIVRAKNNWGGDKVDHTCFYRIKLHGDVKEGEFDADEPI